VVRNEREPDGTSIAERYGQPVTASDVEDLLYRERVPSGTILKVMRAVRQAIVWSRTQAVRPWAGELEHGLTRQHEELREQRRERERALENLSQAIPAAPELYAPRAAAVAPDSLGVNTPGERAEAVWAAQVLDWRSRGAAGRPAVPPVTAEAPVPLPVAPPEVTEPATALSGPQAAQDAGNEPEEAIAEEAGEVFTPAAGPASAPPAQDAPAEPAAPPAAVVTRLPGATAPPAPSEAPAALSGPHGSKKCAKCGKATPLDFFQRDSRSPDGRRARCKVCTSESDDFRRRMVQLRKTLLAAAQDVQDALEAPQDAPEVPGDPEVSPAAVRASQEAPGAVQEALAAGVPGPLAPWAIEGDEETVASVVEEFRQKIEQEFPEEIATGKITVLPSGTEILGNEEEPGQRQCRRCGTLKGVYGFYLRKDGRTRNVCIECECKATRDRRAAKRISSE
jgi:hypothetical protein